jgi:hypothetical protein
MTQNTVMGPIIEKIRALAAPLVAHPSKLPEADPAALSEVIDLIKPIVSTVAQPVQIRYPSDPLDKNVKTYHDLRGFTILDGYTLKTRGDATYNEFGDYIGLMLVLFPTGLRLLYKEGYWTRYPRGRSWCESSRSGRCLSRRP